jgi:NDP-sugar pyrophosphorylase family protein
MVLAAGFGTRLRPLTLERAKPAIPLLGTPLIVRIVERLSKAGCSGFRLNLHHLPESVEQVFQRPEYTQMPVSFSFEPDILGTAGGLKANESFFDSETFILCNGDIVPSVSMTEAMEFHRSHGGIATLLLYPQTPPYRYFPVRIDCDGRLCNFKGAAPGKDVLPDVFVFTGLHILEPEIFEWIPGGRFCEINDEVYPHAMRNGKAVYGFPVSGYWNDVGDPLRYLEAQRDLIRVECDRARRLATGASVAEDARLGPDVTLGPGCVLGPGASVENSILWERVVIRPNITVRNAIIGADLTISRDCRNMVLSRQGERPVASSAA